MLKVDGENEFQSKKIISISRAVILIKDSKKQGKTIGLCNGGFDLLHPGHIKHFESAKKACDLLFVAIGSNQQVAERKGKGRPIYPEQLRAYSVASIESVDYVFISPFKNGIEIIKKLKPSFYIKGPDFVNKTTPGITVERKMITAVGGQIKYTSRPRLSTTDIIEYIKTQIPFKRLLVVVDRDGTLIQNDDFFGRNVNWQKELRFNDDVISLLIYLQTKYQTTKIVITNQSGVARGFFRELRVRKINKYIGNILKKRGLVINSWQYCPDIDLAYARSHREVRWRKKYVKKTTKRKPDVQMVIDALRELKLNLYDFDKKIVLGHFTDDSKLAENLKASYIDVTAKTYERLVESIELITL